MFPKDPFFNVEARRADGWTIVDIGWGSESYETYEERCYGNFKNMVDWCNEVIGSGRENWIAVDVSNWCFKDANKALLFKLRWGGAVSSPS